MALKLTDSNSPYVHSNYYLFSQQLKKYYIDTEDPSDTSRMDQQIEKLKKMSKDLRAEAFEFLGTDTPETAMDKIKNKDAIMSKIGQDVLTTPGAREVLLSSAYSQNWVQKQLNIEDEIADIIIDAIKGTISEKELVDLIADAIYTEDFSKMSGRQQRQRLGKLFRINEQDLEEAFKDLCSKKIAKVRSSSGKLKTYIKKVIHKLEKGDAKAREAFLHYFEKQVRKKAASGVYNINDENTIEQYLQNFKEKFLSNSKIKDFYAPTEASAALGEEIISTVWNADSNSFIISSAVGSMSETEIRKELMPSLETAATWNDPTKFSYTDLILENKDGKKVRVQSKNYIGAYETFIRSGKDVYQSTYLFGEEMLFKDFFNKLLTESGGRANIFGDFNPDVLAYIVANEAWFDERGSYDKGSHSNWRQENEGDTRIFGTDSWLSRALSGALINFLGIIVSEEQVITDLSNVFFLIDNKALVPTYVLIDDVISYYEQGKSELTDIRIMMKKNTAQYAFNNKKEFYSAKAGATEDGVLGEAIYEDVGLVGIGKRQGEAIMGSLKVKSVNLGVSLEKLLKSSWTFD